MLEVQFEMYDETHFRYEQTGKERVKGFMKGILYGVGVGPGDPELMTIKAAKTIRENHVIALPGEVASETTAYKIAVQSVPELGEKKLLSLHMPMTHDKAEQARNHDAAAEVIAEYLRQGENVVFLTLGDPTVYSTFAYVQKRVEDKGFETRIISGVPSFCAAAARAGISLCEWQQQLHVIPAAHHKRKDSPTAEGGDFSQPGTYVLMKAGSKLGEVKKELVKSGKTMMMVENCGMPDEKVYIREEEIPEQAGYFTLVIAKEK